jgi:DNA polymerase III epsilon subunit-like protein
MPTLIFDTETTGMVKQKVPDFTVQPYPVQLACILVEDNKIINIASVMINPGVPIEKGAADVHKITDELVQRVGLSLKAATGLFINFLNKADRIVAHNSDFDVIVTEAMIYRTLADFEMDRYREIPRVCTMRSTTDICKIPGRYGYKWPKLEEAYRKLIDPKGFSGAHDALNDVLACWKILQKLEEMELPLLRGER